MMAKTLVLLRKSATLGDMIKQEVALAKHTNRVRPCPHCGSAETGIMPPDFETCKCGKCGRNFPLSKDHPILADMSKGVLFVSKAVSREPAGQTEMNLDTGKTIHGGEFAPTKPAGRWQWGKSATEEQKRQALQTRGDVYVDNGIPMEFKGFTKSGEEKFGYPYRPEVFHTSAMTGRGIRHYVELPDKDKSLAHPSELFPELSEDVLDALDMARRAPLGEKEELAAKAQVESQKNYSRSGGGPQFVGSKGKVSFLANIDKGIGFIKGFVADNPEYVVMNEQKAQQQAIRQSHDFRVSAAPNNYKGPIDMVAVYAKPGLLRVVGVTPNMRGSILRYLDKAGYSLIVPPDPIRIRSTYGGAYASTEKPDSIKPEWLPKATLDYLVRFPDVAQALEGYGDADNPNYKNARAVALTSPVNQVVKSVATADFHRELKEAIGQERSNVHPDPSDAQKEAGNYRKGHVRIHGLDISIETPKGGTRSGVGPDGKPWSVAMKHDYGYVRSVD